MNALTPAGSLKTQAPEARSMRVPVEGFSAKPTALLGAGRRTALGLASLLLAAGAALPAAAAEPSGTLVYPVACVEFVAEYEGCLDYGDPPEPRTTGSDRYGMVGEDSKAEPRVAVGNPLTARSPE